MLSIQLSKLFRTVLGSDPGQWDGMWQRPCSIQYRFTPGTSEKPGTGERALFLPRRNSCGRHEVCPSLFFIDLGFISVWHVNHLLSVYFCYYYICCYYLFPYLSAISSKLFLSQSVISAFFSH